MRRLPGVGVGRSNGPVTVEDPVALLDRRAALLEGRGDPGELDEVTSALRSALDGVEPAVRRITADEPGDLLVRLAQDEPVHPVRSPEDLANRLADDRRCYVLEHPALPGRPSNVVWVALWKGVAGSVDEILDIGAPTRDPATADTAVFYSIWGVEPGLRRFPGGAALIEGAVAALRSELPHLRTFVTLSPVPGFRTWWEERHPGRAEPDGTGPADEELLAECVEYLTTLDEQGRPIDPVARFHLGNGARLLALHRHGDRSTRGSERSFGIMANYRYEPEDRPANRALLEAGRVPVAEGLVPAGSPDSR